MKFRLLQVVLLLTFGLIVMVGSAQQNSTFRVGHVVVDTNVFRLDSLSIVPESFQIQNLQPTQYQLDPIAATLYVKDSSLIGQTLFYRYQTFQMNFSQPVRHRSVELIEPLKSHYQPAVNPLSTVADLQDEDRLYSSGSISRGVSVGNAQDLVLNSSLNLQLSGKLSDDVEINAVISDRNIPIQPEGNTQTLYDINNIFITLKLLDILRVDAGDIEIFSPKDEFLSVSRNLLGMKANTNFAFGGKTKMVNAIGGGVAKGKFFRQTVMPLNGVQGPYKLYGEDGAVGIVIVAASERVYVDGILQVRGEENDYTMDYNTAELTFTPKMLVTTEKRIVVEFEYTDKHYTRYNLFSYNDLAFGDKWKLRVNYYQEQDLRNQSIQPELNNDQKLFLSTMGDDVEHCYYDFVDTVSNPLDRILYCKKDTIVTGTVYHDVYEYSTSDSVLRYALGFTYMGANKGSYKLLASTANGRVFGWVAPVDGTPSGDYEPVILLSTPKLIQMATVAAEYQIAPKTCLKTELALSNYDQNLFSKKDDNDNVGFAYFLDFNHGHRILNRDKDTTDWTFQSALRWQFVHKNFHAVESFREVEFARDFNLKEDYSTTHSEQMLQADLGFVHAQNARTFYTLNWFSRFGDVSALRNQLRSENHFEHWNFNTKTSYLYTRDSLWHSNFWSSFNDIRYKFQKIELGATDRVEHNIFKSTRTDTLRADAYAFNEAMIYLNNSDSSNYKYGITYKNRLDFAPFEDLLKLNQRVHEVSALFQINRIRNQHFGVNATYRNQSLKDSAGVFSPEHYFVGKLEYTGRFWKNALILSTYYEVGSGMEQTKTFTYVKVADGQGTHVWNDYNGNGIEEIDEFEVAAFQDEADYVKVWLASNDYQNTYNNQFTQSVQLRPASAWGQKTGFRKFLSRFQDVAIFRSQQKQSVPNFNPFYTHLEDTNVVSRILNVNNTFSFNNSSSKFAFDFIVQANQNKSLLYYGYEYSRMGQQQILLKSAPCDFLFLQAGYLHQQNANCSEMLINRNYEIEQHQGDGKVQLQFENRYMGVLSYAFVSKSNLLGGEKVNQHKLSAQFEYRMVKRGILSLTAQYIHIKGNLENGTALSYVMLEGLNVGRNAIWNLSYQMAVTDYLQVSLQYDGRASQGHRLVHTGNVTLKAQF
ncbi:MAG: hypothetical protein MJZ57_03050 [Bacteroidales bacterium]|nr:hypothetical protein [Bacteroidales bacterium]